MAYHGDGGAGGYEDDHRLRDLPRGNVRCHILTSTQPSDFGTSNITYLHITVALMMRKPKKHYYTRMIPALSTVLLMRHTMAPQLRHLDQLQLTV